MEEIQNYDLRKGNEKCHLLRQIYIKVMYIHTSFLIKSLPSYARGSLPMFWQVIKHLIKHTSLTFIDMCVRKLSLYPPLFFFREGDYSCLSRYHIKKKKSSVVQWVSLQHIILCENMGVTFPGDPLAEEKVKSRGWNRDHVSRRRSCK